jgi:outer membrane autotransporter protein
VYKRQGKYNLDHLIPVKGITPFAKIGVGYNNFKYDYVSNDGEESGSFNEKNFGIGRMGIGVKYELMNNLSARLEYENIKAGKFLNKNTYNNASTIGVEYKF